MLENQLLRRQLRQTNRSWGERIDAYIDQWFERNQSEVDIGRVTILGHEVDLFPDWLEKAVYKKLMKIAYSFVRDQALGDANGGVDVV